MLPPPRDDRELLLVLDDVADAVDELDGRPVETCRLERAPAPPDGGGGGGGGGMLVPLESGRQEAVVGRFLFGDLPDGDDVLDDETDLAGESTERLTAKFCSLNCVSISAKMPSDSEGNSSIFESLYDRLG